MPRLRRISKINYSESARKKKSKRGPVPYKFRRYEEPEKLLIPDFSYIPAIRGAETDTVLPSYWTIVHKNERICMDNINKLQQDLERLITTNIHRSYFLQTGRRPVIKIYDPSSEEASLRKKKLSESLLLPEPPKPKNKKQIFKTGCDVPKDPKIILPSYEKTDKFWAFIDPYCAPLTGNGLEFLESLIQEFSKPVDLNIPESEGHYLDSLTDCSLDDDQPGSSSKRGPGNVIKKEEPETLVEMFGSCVVSKTIKNLVKKTGRATMKKDKSAELTAEKRLKRKMNTNRLGVCCEKKFINDLAKENLIECEYKEENDDVLDEIGKCQSELTQVNKFNIEELLKLHACAVKEVQYTSLKEKLKLTDNELQKLYKKITGCSNEDKNDKMILAKIMKELGPSVKALLKDQQAEMKVIYSM